MDRLPLAASAASFFSPAAARMGCFAAVGLATLLSLGCGSSRPAGTPVTFVADPPSARLRVERLASADGTQGEILASGTSPLSTRLALGSPTVAYRVTAEPTTEEARENYTTSDTRYDREALLRAAGVVSAGAPDGSPSNRVPTGPLRVTVPLKQLDSLIMPVILPVYHPRDGWLAVRTRLRAYRNLVEADGTAPELVAPLSALAAVGSPDRMGTEVGVWGLDVTGADGGRIVTSVFRPAADGLNLERDDPEAAERLARLAPDQRARPRLRSDYRFPIAMSELVSLRLTGLTEVRLTSDGHVDLTPAFSPDGQHVFFSSNRDQRGRSDIFRRPALRAGALDVVTRNLPEGGAAWPSQASDGTVAFGFLPAGATTPDGGQVYAKIGGLGGYDSLIVQGGREPRIAPDGQQLAYISRGDLWVCSVDGSQQQRLTTDAAALLNAYGERALSSAADRARFEEFEKQWLVAPYRDVSWSPDGRRLLYSALSGGDSDGRPNYDIWLVDLETGARTQVTTNGSVDLLPRFAPSGNEVYFVSNRGNQWSVWRLPVPGSEGS